MTEHFLDELLRTRRAERQGFPADASAELLALQLCNDERLYGSDVSDESGSA